MPDLITQECRNGHSHEYNPPAGRAVKCRTPECRVSVWLKVRPVATESGSPGTAWDAEPAWAGPGVPDGETASEPCPGCGGDQRWTPGRTALHCQGCGTVNLPAAVRELAAAEAARAAVPALTEGQEIDALIQFEARQTSLIRTLTGVAEHLEDGPAVDLADAEDRKQAAMTASALRTLARLAGEADTHKRLNVLEEKALGYVPAVKWSNARLALEAAEYDDADDADDDDDDDDDEYEGEADYVTARVIEPEPVAARPALTEAPSFALGFPSAVAVARQSRAEQNAVARSQFGECEGRHRTMGIFPYHPTVQYRLWQVDGTIDYTNYRGHVMDGCRKCVDTAAAQMESPYEIEQLWTGLNTTRSNVPMAIAAILLIVGIGALKVRAHYGYGGYY